MNIVIGHKAAALLIGMIAEEVARKESVEIKVVPTGDATAFLVINGIEFGPSVAVGGM